MIYLFWLRHEQISWRSEILCIAPRVPSFPTQNTEARRTRGTHGQNRFVYLFVFFSLSLYVMFNLYSCLFNIRPYLKLSTIGECIPHHTPPFFLFGSLVIISHATIPMFILNVEYIYHWNLIESNCSSIYSFQSDQTILHSLL